MQKLIRDAYTFIEQTARILTKIKNEPLEIALLGKGIERVLDFLFRRLVEARDVHVPDSGANQEVKIHAVTRNLVANHGEVERLVCAFAKDGDVDGSPLRTF